MDDATMNRIALALGTLAILLSLASMVPGSAQAAALLGVFGLAALVGALHTAQPPLRDESEPAPAEADRGATVPRALGVGAGLMILVVLLLLAAALIARIGGVTYLGPVPLFLADHFTLVSGPFVAVLAGAAILAAQGQLTLPQRPTEIRRYVTLGLLSMVTLASFFFALGVGAAEPWQAPYLLALAGLLAWSDAVHLCGLPRVADVVSWIERGETEESRLVVRGLARAGNATVLVLAVAGVGLFVVGMETLGVIAELIAAGLLVVATQGAAGLRKVLPVELEEDVATAKSQQERLRLYGIAPLIVAILAALLTAGAFLALVAGNTDMRDLLSLARPSIGAAIALLAGINLARARLGSYIEHGPVRRAVSVVAVSIVAIGLFFSLLVETGVMSGPVTEQGVGLLFTYAALLGASVFVHARGLYPVPGLEKLLERLDVEEGAPEDHALQLERSLTVVYVISGLFVVSVVGLLSLVTLGGVDMALPESPEGRNAAFLGLLGIGILLLLGLVVVFFRSRQLETPPEDQVTFERKYTPEEVVRLSVLGASGTIAFVLALLGILVMAGQLESIGGLTLEERHSTDFFVFAVLIGIGPAGYLHNRERKRIDAIDARLPEFLRDLAESQRTGMTLTQAVITSAKGNYGALTPEIQKMAAQIEWGVSFEEALKSFAKRVDTPLVQRTVSLVIEASTSGGNVMDVLEAASEDAREIQMIESERKSGMQIYVMIIYIAFFVFLGVIAILNVKFMPEVAKAVEGASGVQIGSITFKEFDIQTFRTLFFHASVIQGLGGGFVAGAMEEGKPVAGLKHAFAMTIIAYVAFRFLLGG